jgi:hypothetical protein
LVEAADLASGELVKKELAGLVEGFHLGDLAAEVAEVRKPVASIEGKLRVDLLTQTLSKGWTGAGGGDGNLQVATADDGGEVEIAVGWIVDCVADDVFGLGLQIDGAVDGGVVGGGDDKEGAGKDIAGGKLALMPANFTGGSKVLNASTGCGRDDGDGSVGGAEGLDFGFSQVASANDDAGAGGEFKKDGKKVHRYSHVLIVGSGKVEITLLFEKKMLLSGVVPMERLCIRTYRPNQIEQFAL